jgi:hypothetical protein
MRAVAENQLMKFSFGEFELLLKIWDTVGGRLRCDVLGRLGAVSVHNHFVL